jgi:Protein of unknown function (DUF4238)
MSRPIDHHHLPVFYLRQWCGADGKVVRYHRPYKQVVTKPITPENTGFEPHLYSLEGFPPEQEAWVETDYMSPVVDEPASKAPEDLLAGDLASMDGAMKTDWTRFLMSLSLRNPEAIAQLNGEMRRTLIAKLVNNHAWYETYKQSGDPATFAEWVERHIPTILASAGTLHLPTFVDNPEIGTLMLRLHWFTFDLGGGGVDLLTSDRPFVRSHGLKDARCLIVVPLSPRIVFVAAHARETAQGLWRLPPERLAADINARVVAQAVKAAYGSTMSHKRFVENRLAL